MAKQAYPAHPTVPISKAIRAGDFVFTSAYGPWTFDPKKVVFDADGNILDDGSGHKDVPFDEQVHLTFGFIKEALAVAQCSLDDVVDCQAWFADAARFRALQRDLPDLLQQGSAGQVGVSDKVHVRLQDRAQGHRLQAARKRLTVRAEIFQVVTFASEPFRGNPAFVLSLEESVPRPPSAGDSRSAQRTGARFASPDGQGWGRASLSHARAIELLGSLPLVRVFQP